MPMSRTAIDRAFSPLKVELTHKSCGAVEGEIAGFKVRAVRRRNLHVRFGGCGGPVWTPHYIVEGLGSGERCHMVEAIYRAQVLV